MKTKPVKRKILHIDMDAFYASVECADRPEISGKPVIVGGSTNRGVVTTASYEARKYGVHSGMPAFKAKILCPHGIFVPVRMKRYKEISKRIMNILLCHSPVVEQASVDEAYLDISGTEKLVGPPEIIAANIKRDIAEETGLTCSIGIAPNKMLAKIASDAQKPDGLTIINETDVSDFMSKLPVQKIPGIGPKMFRKMQDFGIKTAADILKFPETFIVNRFGKARSSLIPRARGIDHSPVVPFSEPKSFSAETTFPYNIKQTDKIKRYLLSHAERVGTDLRKHGYIGRTVFIKIKFTNFKIITRSHTLIEFTSSTSTIFKTAVDLLNQLKLSHEIRLAGLGVSNLTKGNQQLSLFKNDITEKHQQLDKIIDKIRDEFGMDIIKRGHLLNGAAGSDPRS